MLRFIVRRLIQMVGVVMVLSLLLFFWLKALPGGTVSAILGERQTPERRAALEAALGLDQPVYVQYLKFLERAAQGQFGASTKVLPGEDAFQIFLDRFPATLELAALAMLIAVADPHDRQGFGRRQHRAMAAAGVIGMPVGDHRPRLRLRRIDPRIRGRHVNPLWVGLDPGTDSGHWTVIHCQKVAVPARVRRRRWTPAVSIGRS